MRRHCAASACYLPGPWSGRPHLTGPRWRNAPHTHTLPQLPPLPARADDDGCWGSTERRGFFYFAVDRNAGGEEGGPDSFPGSPPELPPGAFAVRRRPGGEGTNSRPFLPHVFLSYSFSFSGAFSALDTSLSFFSALCALFHGYSHTAGARGPPAPLGLSARGPTAPALFDR